MSKAPQLNTMTSTEVRNVAVSFAGKLDAGELLTGTPTVVDNAGVSPEVLAFTNIAVSTGELTINDIVVPLGEAVQFSVSGGVSGVKYTIKVACGTDSTPAQTLDGFLSLRILPDA